LLIDEEKNDSSLTSGGINTDSSILIKTGNDGSLRYQVVLLGSNDASFCTSNIMPNRDPRLYFSILALSVAVHIPVAAFIITLLQDLGSS
jgi:hypothetical protein